MGDVINPKKQDRRVIKTKNAIRKAFVKLLSEKDINDITIKNIADEADVDRKTVYCHYSGVHELLEELENDLLMSMDEIMEDLNTSDVIKNPYIVFYKLTDVINANIEIYSCLMKMNANSRITLKMTAYLKERVKKSMAVFITQDSQKIDFLSEYVTSGMLASYQCWFNSDRTEPLEAFSKTVGDMVLFGIKGFMRLN